VFTFSFARPAILVLVGLLTVATALAPFDVAIAAGPAAAPDAKKSDSAPTLKIRPDEHDFGQVIVSLMSAPKTVTVTNNSKSASIEFTSIVAAPPFAIQSDQCSGSPLTAGNSCKVEVRFHPTTTGKVKDKKALTFTDSAKKSSQYVELLGQGIVGSTPTPAATATPTVTASPTVTQTSADTPTATPTKACDGTCTPTATLTSAATNTATWTPTPSVGPTPTPTTHPTFPPTPTISPTPNGSATPTVTATATCTPESEPTPFVVGKVLIAGGQASNGTSLNTAEVFNPVTNTFTLTTAPALGGSNMMDGRYSHAAAPLHSTGGDILLSGGFDSTGVAKSTETFSGTTNQFTLGADMLDSRQGHTATSLARFQVLIAGGQDAGGTVLNSAEVVNGTAPGLMNTARVGAAAVVEKAAVGVSRSDTCPGPVIVTGGSDGVSALQSAELFDPNSLSFTLTDAASLGGSQMNAARVFHTATLLSNSGNLLVLVAGGEGVAGTAQASAEIFTVATNTFTLTTALGGTNMTVARAKQTATALGPTTVLLAGGIDSSGIALASAETFDLSTNSFTAVGSMHSARFDHAAALLPNGKVLITGGEDGSGNTLNTAEIFDPATNTFTLTTDPSLGGNNMNVARKLHTATAY